MSRTLVLGGPGAGKTKTLLDKMEEALDLGVDPGRIAFATFTRGAAEEARTRACKKFGLAPADLPHFRTIHSAAFRALGLRRNEVVDEAHLAEVGEITGELFTGDSATEGPAAGRNADPLLTIDHYARTTMTSLRDAWGDHGGEVEWFRLQRFSDSYRQYKTDMGLLDFTDMLEGYLAEGRPIDVDVAIVDEGQDLTRLQWRVVGRAFAGARDLWIAGDDDQSIHRWAGADEDGFLSLPHDRLILPLSHRLPRSIFDFSQEIVHRISRRFEKAQTSQDRSGSIEWVADPSEVNLGEGSWMMLARTRSQMTPMIEVARDQGVAYSVKGRPSIDPDHVRAIRAHEDLRAGRRIEGREAGIATLAAGVRKDIKEDQTYTALELGYDASPIWHDALIRIPTEDREYYLSCMRRGQRLTDSPRVRIDTIHGSKGLEAENVVLGTDLTYRTNRGYELDPDSELRVFYVGATRASESLHLVAPQTSYGFPL